MPLNAQAAGENSSAFPPAAEIPAQTKDVAVAIFLHALSDSGSIVGFVFIGIFVGGAFLTKVSPLSSCAFIDAAYKFAVLFNGLLFPIKAIGSIFTNPS